MPLRKLKPFRFYLADGTGALILVDGWESSHALGVVRLDTGFASVMLMSGLVLAEGFETEEHAHQFNLAVLSDGKLFVGTPSAEEFLRKSGGKEAAAARVELIKKRALKVAA